MISASHNPFEDNGIKVFSGRGEKFTEDVERHVEAIIADTSRGARPTASRSGRRQANASSRTSSICAIVFPEVASLGPFKLAIDCANGATTPVAPQLFMGLGVELVVIGDEPDGHNINLQCGSTHPGAAVEDRRRARVRHGRRIRRRRRPRDLRRPSRQRRQRRRRAADVRHASCSAKSRLVGNAVVATVMSNIGLELAFRESGIEMVRTAVGDKYVMEEMIKRGATLGGEQSGHVIFSDYLYTGDGLCTALNVLRTVAMTGRSLADLASDLTNYPQVLLNVRVRERVDLADGAGRRRRDCERRSARRRPGTGAGALFRHRAAAARDARRPRRRRDPRLGPGNRGRRQRIWAASRIDIHDLSPSTSTRSRRSETPAAAVCRA